MTMKQKLLLLITLLFITSCNHLNSTSNLDIKPQEIEKIPFIVYTQKNEGELTAQAGQWDISHAQIAYKEKLYTFAGERGAPLFWRGKSLVLNKGSALMDRADGADRANGYYHLQITEAQSTFEEQSYFFEGFSVTTHLNELDPVYDIYYQNEVHPLKLNDMDEFRAKRSYLANAELHTDLNIIRLVFTAIHEEEREGKGGIIVVDYSLSGNVIVRIVEFPGKHLPFGDMILSPDNTILEGNRLYAWRSNDFGYFDLDQQEFMEQQSIYTDIQSFTSNREPNPVVQQRIIPVGKIGNVLLLYDPTLYYDDGTSGMIIYAYSDEKPVGKLLIKGEKLYIYDSKNKQVGDAAEFMYARSEGFTFPK